MPEHTILFQRAADRVLNARTISAKIDGETVSRIDDRVQQLTMIHGAYSQAALVRSALRLYFEALDRGEEIAGDVVEGTARET